MTLISPVHAADEVPLSGNKVAAFAPLDKVILEFMERIDGQAATVAVMRDGKVLYVRGYGWSDKGGWTCQEFKTGKVLWTSKVVDYKQGSVITSPPLVVRDKVITGFGGGEYGVRGSLQAFDINTGKQVWQTYTVPNPDAPPDCVVP